VQPGDGRAACEAAGRLAGVVMSVVKAVEHDIKALAKLKPELAKSALAASALALAAEIDKPSNSATSKSMCARALLDTLDRLRGLAPDGDQKDKLDELSTRRAARIAGRPGA
jgi:hypothetical protein